MNEKGYRVFCRILTVSSSFSIALVLFSALCATLSVVKSFVLSFAVLLFMILGYFIQVLTCKIFGFKRKTDDCGYESSEKFFSLPRALPAIVIDIIAVSVIFVLTSRMYPKASLSPLIFTVLFSFPILIGAVVWFYPDSRLISFKKLLVAVPFFVAVMIIISISDNPLGYIVPSVYMLIYVVSTLIMLNQTNMIKNYWGTVVNYATMKDRRYNVLLVFSLILVGIAGTFIVYVILNGLRVLLLMLLAVTLFGPSISKSVAEKGDGATFEGEINLWLYGTEKASDSVNFYLFLIFLLLFILILAYIGIKIFARGFKISKFFKRIADAIMGFFYHISTRFDKPKYDEIFILNYVDDERKTSVPIASAFDPKRNGFEEFMRRYDTLGDEKVRLMFSYSVFVSLLNNVSADIKRSDTPREIMRKLSKARKKDIDALIGEYDIKSITRAFEIVAYSDCKVSPNYESVTVALISMIKRLYGIADDHNLQFVYHK